MPEVRDGRGKIIDPTLAKDPIGLEEPEPQEELWVICGGSPRELRVLCRRGIDSSWWLRCWTSYTEACLWLQGYAKHFPSLARGLAVIRYDYHPFGKALPTTDKGLVVAVGMAISKGNGDVIEWREMH